MSRKYITQNEMVGFEKISHQKMISKQLYQTKKTLSQEDRDALGKVIKKQQKLAKLKTAYRKGKDELTKEERAQARAKIKTYEKTVKKSFRDVVGLKYNRKSKTYEQTREGKRFTSFNKYGLTTITRRRSKEWLVKQGWKANPQAILDKADFMEKFTTNGVIGKDLKNAMLTYGITGHWQEFRDETSRGWIVRFRDFLGVSEEVDVNEFIDWLEEAGAGGVK